MISVELYYGRTLGAEQFLNFYQYYETADVEKITMFIALYLKYHMVHKIMCKHIMCSVDV